MTKPSDGIDEKFRVVGSMKAQQAKLIREYSALVDTVSTGMSRAQTLEVKERLTSVKDQYCQLTVDIKNVFRQA